MRRGSIRLGLKALGLAAVAAGPVRADVDGFLLLKPTSLERNDSRLNPGNVFDLPPGAAEAAALVEGTVATVRFRLRAETRGPLGSDTPGSGFPKTPQVHLQELYLPVSKGGFFSVSVGKQVRSWDQGLSYLPLGFFRTTPDVTDPTDVEGRVSGLPLIVLTHVGEKLSIEAIASDSIDGGDAATRLNQRQIAVRFSGQAARELEAAVILRIRDRAEPGFGGSLSYAHGAVELHGDVYLGQPEATLRRRPLFTDPARFYLADPQSLYVPRGFVASSVAGFTYSVSRELTLRGEWAHHGGGLDAVAWRSYLANIAYHGDGLTAADPRARPSLGYDLAEFGSGGKRIDYAFVGATLEHNDLSASIFSLVGLADGSTTTTFAGTCKLTKNLDAAVQATAFTGSRGSEFGLSPYKHIISLRLIQRF